MIWSINLSSLSVICYRFVAFLSLFNLFLWTLFTSWWDKFITLQALFSPLLLLKSFFILLISWLPSSSDRWLTELWSWLWQIDRRCPTDPTSSFCKVLFDIFDNAPKNVHVAMNNMIHCVIQISGVHLLVGPKMVNDLSPILISLSLSCWMFETSTYDSMLSMQMIDQVEQEDTIMQLLVWVSCLESDLFHPLYETLL